MLNSTLSFVHDPHSTINYGVPVSRFSENSEGFASNFKLHYYVLPVTNGLRNQLLQNILENVFRIFLSEMTNQNLLSVILIKVLQTDAAQMNQTERYRE